MDNIVLSHDIDTTPSEPRGAKYAKLTLSAVENVKDGLAFGAFSQSRLAERMHGHLVEETLGDELVGHVSRDSTAIEGREKPAPKPRAGDKPRRKRGRPRKGEARPKEPTRLERQAGGMSLADMLDELPKACDVGSKRNAKGFIETWRGDKLHIDTADCGVPVSAVLTSAWCP